MPTVLDPAPAEPTTARPPARRAPRLVAAIAAGLALAVTGCQTTAGKGLLGLISPSYDESMANGMVRPDDDNSTPGRFLARYLNPQKAPHASAAKEPKALTLGKAAMSPVEEKADPAAEAQVDAATRLYRQGKHEEAEPLFEKIAKKYKGTRYGERAQLLLAESYYERGRYFWANDAYEQLYKDYPGNPENVDRIVTREFDIAKRWMDDVPPKDDDKDKGKSKGKADPKDKTASKDKGDGEAPVAPRLKIEEAFPIMARLTGRAPLIDSTGYAIKNLENVRQHDPAGPLSDDAVMKMADYHFRNGDYDSAAMYYEQLVTDHPKSELLQKAQLAAIDARLKDYMGPEFDGQGLEKARAMIEQTRTAFPDRQTATAEKLYKIEDLLEDQQAERAYRVGLYYKDKARWMSSFVTPAEYYFSMTSAKWPKSEWGKKSKVELASLAKRPRKQSTPSRIMTQPVSGDPFGGTGNGTGMGSNGGAGGMGAGGMGNMLGGMGGMGGPG